MNQVNMLLIMLIIGIIFPVVAVGVSWRLRLLTWSPFWNERFKIPFYRGYLYKNGVFVGSWVRSIESIRGKPHIEIKKWGVFSRPKEPEQEFKHGAMETRLIYRVDSVDAGRWGTPIEPVKLIFGDDPATIQKIFESKAIEDLTARNKEKDYTTILLVVAVLVFIAFVVWKMTG